MKKTKEQWRKSSLQHLKRQMETTLSDSLDKINGIKGRLTAEKIVKEYSKKEIRISTKELEDHIYKLDCFEVSDLRMLMALQKELKNRT